MTIELGGAHWLFTRRDVIAAPYPGPGPVEVVAGVPALFPATPATPSGYLTMAVVHVRPAWRRLWRRQGVMSVDVGDRR